jgi:mannose-6-phosphate isomerase-like protein (cupin superfamily)
MYSRISSQPTPATPGVSHSSETAPLDVTFIPPNVGESWWVITNHQVMKLTSAATGGALSLWFETVPPGGGPPPHVHHAEDEVFIVTEGEITFQSGDRSWVGHAGAVVFGPRGIPHAFKNTGASVARMIILVTPGGFDNYFRDVAFRSANSEIRPPIEKQEFDQLIDTAPRYELEFQLPQHSS